jgi:hypothetical protein
LCGLSTIVILKSKWTINTDLQIFLSTISTRIFSTREIGIINATDLLVAIRLQPQEVEHLLFFVFVTEVAALLEILLLNIEIHFVLINL